MLAINLMCAVLVVHILSGSTPTWMVGGWAFLTGLVGVVATLPYLNRVAASRRAVGTVRDGWLSGAALGVVWSMAFLALAASVPPTVAFALWLLGAVMMMAIVAALGAVPLLSIAFVATAGSSAAVMLLLAGMPFLSAGTLAFVALLIVLCVERARAIVDATILERTLRDQEATIALLLRQPADGDDHIGDWLWETDAQRCILRTSPGFADAMGRDPATIPGTPLVELLAGKAWASARSSAGLRRLTEKLQERRAFRDLVLPIEINGATRWWQVTASPRTDESGAFAGFRGVASDVTERRDADDRINRMARFDMLTGLPNRMLINETLAEAVANAQAMSGRTAFMMIDLDRFKAVNDTLGHPVGDRLLGRVAERLGQLMTANEMVGRLGGDEFAVVVRDATDTVRVERFAATLIETLSQPYEVDQHTLYIGASVGLAFSPRDGRSAETLIRSADLALYRSKDKGGGVVNAYEPQLHVAAEERRVLEIALRGAIEKGELHLAYQPVVDAGTGALTGFEALLRWTHPELGPIAPARFVPLAEEARLIGTIGEWVIRTACREAARWPAPIRIAVNVSSEQLHNAAFVTVVAQALSHAGLAPDRLELEVTETVFLREGTQAIQTLERILDLGVRLSLDDFGTGYSSLGYLSKTRFSSIKIDRSFVVNAAKGVKEAVAIVRAVVALADSLSMATTAEGVETEEELAMVRRLGCTRVQGYHFGRPLPVEHARERALTIGSPTQRTQTFAETSSPRPTLPLALSIGRS